MYRGSAAPARRGGRMGVILVMVEGLLQEICDGKLLCIGSEEDAPAGGVRRRHCAEDVGHLLPPEMHHYVKHNLGIQRDT